MVLKEALNNVVKHAHTSEVRLFLGEAAGVITITVEDDGCGFDNHQPDAGENGNGLDNMRKRIEKLGGTFSLTTEPGRGTKLKFVVAVDSNSRPTK